MKESDQIPGKVARILRLMPGCALGFTVSFMVSCLFEIWAGRLGRDPELGRRAVCSAKLSWIHKGLYLYMADNADRPPPDLPTLVRSDLISRKMLVCPSSGAAPAATTQPADLNRHCDYIYVAGLKQDTPADLIWAFELPANHGQDAANVFQPGLSVQCVSFYPDADRRGRDSFLKSLQRTNDHLAAERRAGP